jgi:hypothetical protein
VVILHTSAGQEFNGKIATLTGLMMVLAYRRKAAAQQ